MADALRGQLKRGLHNSVLYIGKTAQLSTFKLTLDGVPGSQMNDKQLDFFTTFTQDFVSQWIAQSIYAMEVQSQEVTPSSSLSKSLVVNGEIRGANEAGNTIADSFAQNIANAISDHSAEYMEGLAYNVVCPTSMLDATEAAYFRGITRAELVANAVFQSLAPTPTPAPVSTDVNQQGGGNDKTIDDLTHAAGDANTSSLVIVGVIAVICIAIGVIVTMICCRYKRRRDDTVTGKKPYKSFDNMSDDEGEYNLPSKTKKFSDSENSFMASSRSVDLGSVRSEEKTRTGTSLESSQRQLQRAPSSLGRVSPFPGLDLQRAPSMNGLGSKTIPPPPLLQRQPSTRAGRDPRVPSLGRSQSGDGLPSMSAVPRPPPPKRAQSSVAALSSTAPRGAKDSMQPPTTARSKSGDGINLFSPQPQRPTVQRVPSSMSESGNTVKSMRTEPRMPPPGRSNSGVCTEPRMPPPGRSKSGDGIPIHSSPRIPQREKSSNDASTVTSPSSRPTSESAPKPQLTSSPSPKAEDVPTRSVSRSSSGKGTGASPIQPAPQQRSRNPPTREQSMGRPRTTGQHATSSRDPSAMMENGPAPPTRLPQRVASIERTTDAPPVKAPLQRVPSMRRTGSSGTGSDHRRAHPTASPRAKKEEAPVSPRRSQSMPNKDIGVSSSKGPSSNQNKPTRPSAPQRTVSMPISKGNTGPPSKQHIPTRPSTPQRSDSKPRTPLAPIT
jgi:hypothetical protein